MAQTQHEIQTELEQANLKLENYRQAFDTLVEENIRLKSMLEHIPSGVALVDETGKPIQNNRALADMLGYTSDELLNMSFAEFTHPDDLDEDLEYYRQLLKAEISGYSLKKRYIHKSGKIIWAYLTVTHYLDPRGNRQVLATLVEASSIKRLEHLIRQQETIAPKAITPVCSYCHNIREADGSWKKFEAYLGEHFSTSFTHGICPECVIKEFKKI